MSWGPLLDPPLVPTPDQGRDLLRRELLDPAYHQDDVIRRLLDWLRRRVLDVLDAASNAPPLSAFAAMAVGLALVLGPDLARHPGPCLAAAARPHRLRAAGRIDQCAGVARAGRAGLGRGP